MLPAIYNNLDSLNIKTVLLSCTFVSTVPLFCWNCRAGRLPTQLRLKI